MQNSNFFLAFRIMPSKCSSLEENPNISLNLMCSFSCGFAFLPSLLGSRLSTFSTEKVERAPLGFRVLGFRKKKKKNKEKGPLPPVERRARAPP